MNYQFKLLAFTILVIMLLATGCNKSSVHKSYSFKRINNIERGWGKLFVGLLGKDHKININLSVRESPYNLLIAFTSLDEKINSACEINLKILKLINTQTGKIVLSNESKKARIQKGSESIFFQFHDLKMDYDKHRLNLRMELSSKCPPMAESRDFELILEKDYSEEKYNKFWAALMSV